MWYNRIMKEKKRKAIYNREADLKWAEKNRERRNYLSKRSSARSFIKTVATADDLEELSALIKERQDED